jgi:hypothetical protein
MRHGAFADQTSEVMLEGRVTITPTMPKAWELRGQGTLAGLFSRNFPLGMASPPGFEPGFQP